MLNININDKSHCLFLLCSLIIIKIVAYEYISKYIKHKNKTLIIIIQCIMNCLICMFSYIMAFIDDVMICIPLKLVMII